MSFVHAIAVGHYDRYARPRRNLEPPIRRAMCADELAAIERQVEADTGRAIDLGRYLRAEGVLRLVYTTSDPFPRFAWYVARAAHVLFGTITVEKGDVYSPRAVDAAAEAPARVARLTSIADPRERVLEAARNVEDESIGFSYAIDVLDRDDPRTTEALLGVLRDRAVVRRQWACWCLDRAPPVLVPKVVAALDAALDDDHSLVRRAAIQALRRFPSAVPSLERAVRRENAFEREPAIEGIVRLRLAAAIPLLVALLDDENARSYAVHWIKWLAKNEEALAAIPALEAMRSWVPEDLACMVEDALEALGAPPLDAVARLRRARFAERCHRADEALVHYEHVATSGDATADQRLAGIRGASDVHRARGRLDEAARWLALAPEAARWDALGEAYWKQRRWVDSNDAYDHALALAPRLVSAWSGKGRALRLMARFEESLVADERAVALAPDAYDLHHSHARSLAGVRRFDDALAAYDEVLRRRPEDVSALAGRARLLHRLGRFDDALAGYHRMIASPEAGPASFAAAYGYIGDLERLRGRDDAAAAAYERGFEVGGAAGWLLASLAALSVARGDLAAALAAYDRACAASPSVKSIATARAWVHFALGRDVLEQATDPLLRAFALNRAGRGRDALDLLASEKTSCVHAWSACRLAAWAISGGADSLLSSLPSDAVEAHAEIAGHLDRDAENRCEPCERREDDPSALACLAAASLIAGDGASAKRLQALVAELERVGQATRTPPLWSIRFAARTASLGSRDMDLLEHALRAVEGDEKVADLAKAVEMARG
jgi:tetratricopeptide (TPR) repeat protein